MKLASTGSPQPRVRLEPFRRPGDPDRWDRRLEFHDRRRYVQLTTQSLDALGRSHGDVPQPPLDPGFLGALRLPRAAGYGDRTSAMRALFGYLLPDAGRR